MVRFIRRSRVRSSRGHVRVDQSPGWDQWIIGAIGLVALVIVAVVVITQAVLPLFEEDDIVFSNRTWLEFAWTTSAPNSDNISQLAQRLRDHDIDRVYVEVAAWRSDGTLLEGEFASEFARMLRDAYPEIEILVWLRMAGSEIADETRQAAVVSMSRTAMRQWEYDGVQLNGRAVYNDSESYIVLLRALREAMGNSALLSATVPPDRQPADPDVPMGATGDPELTWSLNYKQRVGLLDLDEIVVMAHASGLAEAELYQVWTAYQVESYASAMGELEQPPDIVVALPTYDVAPEHDPNVENVMTSVRGVKDGIDRAGKQDKLIKGVGLYEYKTTDSREWVIFAEQWMGKTGE